ncbi:SEC-C metal-binding domain-containing protein [Magnetospirillum sp. 15-1]|uniref:SEC-C metal-binding domain-containing protein n=1 Tax=Magnetospirillum sp. 15-1 TaxID=1979370 RepID=UPI000BBC5F5B|nr:SEC-C metal-binding domain-containing protein [Magnetospirillum sp. 15-1]
MGAPRPEQEIFDELGELTATPGFAHVIAYFCVRDNFTWYHDEICAEDMQHLYSRSRLIRTEMFTLIGLMVRADSDYDASPPEDASRQAERAEALLEELHHSMTRPWLEGFREADADGAPPNPWKSGDAMREPIFYGGEAAFSFQNCDSAAEKYATDDAWLLANKGASIKDMIAVAKAIGELQNEKMTDVVHAGAQGIGDPRFLSAFMFSIAELEPRLELEPERIFASVLAFTLPQDHRNPGFKALHDFNAVTATQILAVDEARFLLFHFNALADALYESPFYWLGADKDYAKAALTHRGQYTEAFALQRLTEVFGVGRVYKGVNIDRSKGNRLGEIDVLVLFGDRAIVLQAKSKRLTMESRRGNDLQLKGDFKAAVQDAYDQAMECAEALLDPTLHFTAADGQVVKVPSELTQIFPICLVADHYPALAFQTDQFLVRRKVQTALAPLIIDVFTLDVMAEMLRRPMRFLSYLDLRSLYGSKVRIHHEITLLSYHLKYNLWLDDEYDFVALEDDFAADIEIAMGARRFGPPGKPTPEGILTAIEGRRLDALIKAIEAEPFGPMIDLVMLLYQLSGNAMKELADGIDRVLEAAQTKGSSDFTLGFANTGITVHANFAPRPEAEPRLEAHMMLRKYSQKANQWFGLCLSPATGAIRFGKKVAFPWKFDGQLKQLANQLGKPARPAPTVRQGLKLGRNAPCHCGSGKKYKKCHLVADGG